MKIRDRTVSWREGAWLALFALGVVLLVPAAWSLRSIGLGGVESLVGIVIAVGGSVVFGSMPGVVRRLHPLVIEVLGTVIPGVADQQKDIEECEELCRNMAAVVRFYDLGPVPAGLGPSVVGKLTSPWYGGSSSRLRQCARLFSRSLAAARPPDGVSEDLLVLLYSERNRPMPARLFPPRDAAGERTLDELARILADHHLVQRSWRSTEPELRLPPAVLRAVLGGLMKLRFEDVLTVVRALHDLWSVADAYGSFVLRNFSDVQARLLPAGVLKTVEVAARGFPSGPRSVDELQRAVPSVLTDLGRGVVRSWLAASPDAPARLDEDDVRAVALVSLAAFFSRSGDLAGRGHLSTVCHELARLGSPERSPWRGHGVGTVWVYLVAKQEHRNGLWGEGERQLRLDLFLRRRAEILGRRREEEDELRALYFALQQGEWIVRREELVDRVDEPPPAPAPAPAPPPAKPQAASPIAVPPADVMDVIERIPTSEGPLRQLFLRLDLETIERLTESKRIRPYLLTVGRSDEPVTALLDCLASESKAGDLAAAGIGFRTEEGGQKYNFVQYTPYSRIGLVPPDLAFIDFCKQLRRDLQRALEKQAALLPPSQRKGRDRPGASDPDGERPQEEVRPYEVLAHIFRPAVGNPFEFGRGERRGMLELKRILARHIDRPALAHLPEHFEHFEPALRVPVVTELMRGPISRAGGPAIAANPTVLRTIDRFDESIKERFLAGLGVGPHDDETLLEAIGSGSDRRAEALGLLARAIRTHVAPDDLDDEQLGGLAEAYVRELEGLTLALVDLETAIGRGFLVTSR